jgi:hypothetical protein
VAKLRKELGLPAKVKVDKWGRPIDERGQVMENKEEMEAINRE